MSISRSNPGRDAQAAALREALRAAGFPCAVEARDALAVLVPEDPAALTAERRRELVALARQHGFSHVALEVVDGGAAGR